MKLPTVSGKWLFALMGLLLLAGLGFVVARSGPLAPIRVTVAKVEQGTVAPALFGIGTVEARRAYLIGPTVAGRVKRVLVDVGDPVRAGQLLAEMDPVDLDQRVAALDAGLARARSAVAVAQAQQQDAASKRELAAINARRYTELGARMFVSQSVVDAKIQEEQSARAGLEGAAAALVGARQDIERQAAERQGLRQQRANVRLLAPSDGVVSAREAEPGSTVVAGQAVLRLVDPASLWLRVRFDQGRSEGLAEGLPARIVLRSQPKTALPGKVARVELVSDAITEERIAQIVFTTPPTTVSIGELAEVTLDLPAAAPSPVVPNASLKQLDEQSGVWVIADGHPRFVPVKAGARGLDGRVQILDGLKAGSEVVVYSERELAATSRVKVVPALAGQKP
ncbi:MAG: efflux RND transporter periplasmic adaptor subunit [Gallionellaceae bacterium]|nr:efflux RND transporter periplasmic adaptor subunit [Gallionellaceae bacterium]